MIAIDLQDVESLARQIARNAGKGFDATWERTERAATLTIASTNPDAGVVAITTLEPGTLYLELLSGVQAEWLIRTEDDWRRCCGQLRTIFGALFRGSVVERVKHCAGGFTEVRATIVDRGNTITLVRRGRPLPCVGRVSMRHYGAFPDA